MNNVMNETPIRYGILSTASILKRFAGAMQETRNGTILAVASRTAEKAKTAAEELGIPLWYDDYRKLLENPDIDAVYIPVLNSLHYTYARDALMAGKHVVMEKPFTLHAWQAEELAELAASRHLFLTEAIKTPFLPVYDAVLEQLKNRNLGRIRFMEFKQSYVGGSYISGWNKQKEYGGGVLFGNEAYFFRMAERFGGRIVSCTGQATYGEEVEDQIALTVRFESGALATLCVSTDILFDNGLVIYLDRGRVVIPDYWKASSARIYEDGVCTWEESFPCDYEFQYELKHYNACMQKGLPGSPVNPIEDTIRYIRFCEALQASWQNG